MNGNKTNLVPSRTDFQALDRTDVAIIRLLQNNARLPLKRIAAEVGLVASSVHERVRRLWQSGALRATHVDVDPRALGVGLEALLMIELTRHARDTVDTFMDEVQEIPEVRAAWLISGRYDVVVHVMVRDTRHLKDLSLDRFTQQPAVSRIETSIIFETRQRWVAPVYRDFP